MFLVNAISSSFINEKIQLYLNAHKINQNDAINLLSQFMYNNSCCNKISNYQP